MVLGDPSCNASPYLWPAQVVGRAHTPSNKFVEKTVVESGEERRGELVVCEDGVRGGLTVSVYKHLRAPSIGTQKYRVPVDFVFGQARKLVYGFEKLDSESIELAM